MIPTLVVVNQRGGVGKTTTALAVAHDLSLRGKRVLLVDLDGQDSITRLLRIEKQARTVFDMLESESPWRDCVIELEATFHVIPADRRLGRIEALLADRFRKQELLKGALASLTGYDAVIIDCSPSLSVLHANAFSAASDVLLPVSMDLLSISGANAVLAHLNDFKRYCGYGPVVAGVLPTMYDKRQRIERELLPVVEKAFQAVHVFEPIRIDTKIKQATLRGANIYEGGTLSRGAADYRRFVAALLARRWPALLAQPAVDAIREEVAHVG
jgi:chromosome partitioning protein